MNVKTVGELIEALLNYPEDMKIVVAYSEIDEDEEEHTVEADDIFVEKWRDVVWLSV